MEIVIWILIGLAWWASGFIGSIYWWRRDYDVNGMNLLVYGVVSIVIGPISAFAVWLMCQNRKRPSWVRKNGVYIKKTDKDYT